VPRTGEGRRRVPVVGMVVEQDGKGETNPLRGRRGGVPSCAGSVVGGRGGGGGGESDIGRDGGGELFFFVVVVVAVVGGTGTASFHAKEDACFWMGWWVRWRGGGRRRRGRGRRGRWHCEGRGEGGLALR